MSPQRRRRRDMSTGSPDRDMLPSIVQEARILRYGYESTWFGRDAMRQNASAVAQRLLLSLLTGKKGMPAPLCTKFLQWLILVQLLGIPKPTAYLRYPLLWRARCPQGEIEWITM